VSSQTVNVSGDLDSIGGQHRYCITALDARTGKATAWDAYADGLVRELVASCATVYAILGDAIPISIGRQTRSGIAALDARTGKANAWDPKPGKDVFTLAKSGQTVYVAGYFDSVGGQARHGIAALDARGGNAAAWNPRPKTPRALPTTYPPWRYQDRPMYVGSEFTSIGGQPRNGIAAVNARTGKRRLGTPHRANTPTPTP